MSFDGTVNNRKILAIMHCVKNGNFKCCAIGNGSFTRLKINSNPVFIRETLEPVGESFKRIIFTGKIDAAAKAHPLNVVKKLAEFLFYIGKHPVKQSKVAILAVIVNHETVYER